MRFCPQFSNIIFSKPYIMHNNMFKRFFILICAVCSFIGTQAQSAADAVVANALNGGNPFKLLRAYEASRDSLSPMIGCFAKAMIANDFNNPAEACEAIDSLVENHQDEIGLGNTMTMIYLKAANMAKEGRYAEASQVLTNVVDKLSPHVDKSSLSRFSEKAAEYAELAKFPIVNGIDIPSSGTSISIPFYLDTIQANGKTAVRMFIDATINGQSLRVLFDTGAGANVISEAAAKRLNLRLLGTEGTMRGVGNAKGRKAIAERLQLGGLEMRNVTFIVADIRSGVDSIDNRYFKSLDAVIGVEVINAAKEMRLDFKNKHIVIPTCPSPIEKADKHNLAISRMGLFQIEAAINGVKYPTGLDTGASASVLNGAYFKENEKWITANCKEDSVREAGVGGIRMSKAYRMENVPVAVGQYTHVFPHLLVATTEDENMSDLRFANLGIDFFLPTGEVLINTKDMFVRIAP